MSLKEVCDSLMFHVQIRCDSLPLTVENELTLPGSFSKTGQPKKDKFEDPLWIYFWEDMHQNPLILNFSAVSNQNPRVKTSHYILIFLYNLTEWCCLYKDNSCFILMKIIFYSGILGTWKNKEMLVIPKEIIID